MPTLSAMFKLYDNYSSTVKKIIENSDKAARTVLGASKKTDDYNESLKRTSTAANAASGGLARLIGTVVSLAAVKKGMDMTDIYTNTNARLSMITENLEEQKALQNDVFAAANRARGSYVDMANAAAKMRMLAGDSFGSNQEALGFTELLQKSLKVSGAGQAEQNSAFLQITQAMAAGKLQGDEFRSVMENAPMVANAIAEYMGKSKGELKEMSSQGLITSDIIKNAMFSAADDINGKFAQMPMTFADVWTRIKNSGMQAFGSVFEKANNMLNSDKGQAAIQNLTGAVHMAAGAFSALLDGIGWVSDNLDVLGPVVFGIAAAWLIYSSALGITNGVLAAAAMAETIHAASVEMSAGATFFATASQYGFNAALMACPITWVVGGIILLIGLLYAGVAAFNHFSGSSVSATGMIVGALSAAGAFVGNILIAGWNFAVGIGTDVTNLCISFAEFFANFLNNPVLAIMNLIADLANFVIGVMQSCASAIDAVFGSNLSAVVGGWTNSVNSFKNGIKQNNSVSFERIDKAKLQLERFGYGNSYNKGYDVGSSFADKASNLFAGFNPEAGGASFDFSQFGNAGSSATAGNPATVKGTGKGGAVKVENEEDIEWMRKLAERDYVARIAQNTLAPSIKVEFTGPITKEADVDGVAAHMAEQLKEIIATAPEGVYP